MDLINRCSQFIVEKKIFSPNHHILIALSGGVDSVVLVHILKSLQYPISIAHCNFQLRGEESNRDELFVKELAKKYELPFYCKRFDTIQYSADKKENTQLAARNLRYEWFKELINPLTGKPFDMIATAHHKNDVVETVLHNFFKGTGIAGLHGILPKQTNIVRPLVAFSKAEIIQYAKENQLEFVEDSSNVKNDYTRNFLRNEMIPALEQKYPTIEDNIYNTVERLQEVELLYKEILAQKLQKIVVAKNNEIGIPILLLKKEKAFKTILWEIVKEYNFSPTQLNDLIGLMDAENSKFVNSSTHRIIKNRNWLLITSLQSIASTSIIITELNSAIDFELGTILFESKENASIKTEQHIAIVSSSKIKWPLTLRPWKEGDYFYPLGMQKKKKLSRFFIDQKLSKTEKEKVWVLESNQRIIWVVGYRIDDRFKIEDTSKPALQISLRKSGML